MLKFENVAIVGERVLAYDFEPIEGRNSHFVIGKVVNKTMEDSHGYSYFTVDVEFDSDNVRVGDYVKVPMETTFDFDNRVQRLPA